MALHHNSWAPFPIDLELDLDENDASNILESKARRELGRIPARVPVFLDCVIYRQDSWSERLVVNTLFNDCNANLEHIRMSIDPDLCMRTTPGVVMDLLSKCVPTRRLDIEFNMYDKDPGDEDELVHEPESFCVDVAFLQQPNMSLISELRLEKADISCSSLLSSLGMLHNLRKLELLYISFPEISWDNWQSLSLPNLISLHLKLGRLSTEKWKEVMAFIAGLYRLQKLELEHFVDEAEAYEATNE